MQSIGLWFWRLTFGNPMAVRVVNNGSRRLRDLWVRMGYLGAMVGLVLVGLIAGEGLAGTISIADLAKNGTWVFQIVAFGQVILVCLLAPLFMASAIAAEQQGKTYDILLTTPLSNLQIVLGSLGGRLFFILALLLSGLPLFSILLIFGGVPVASVFIAFATAACTAIFVGSIAVTLSVLRVGGRKAIFGFVIAIIAFLVAAYVFDAAVLRRLPPAGYTTWLTPLHPLLVLQSAIQTASYQPRPESLTAGYPWPIRLYLSRPFTAFALLSIGGSVLMLAGSAVLLRAIGQGESRLFKTVRKTLRLPDPGERRRDPRAVTGSNPIAWRESHTRGNAAAAVLTRWGFAAAAVLLGLGFTVAYHLGTLPSLGASSQADIYRGGLVTLLLIEVTIIVLVALYMSAGSVSREREDGTLDIFLTTPITPRFYIWGKLRGLIQFLALLIAVPVATLAIASAYAGIGALMQWPQATAVQTTFTHGSSTKVTSPIVLLEAPLLLLVMLVPFVALVVATGMTWSLKAKGVLGAVIPSVAILGSLTLVLGLCGYGMATEVPYLGAVVNAFSPATNLLMIVDPWSTVNGFIERPGPARITIAIGAALAALGYALIVYALIVGMVKGFDHTVRKLSGTA